MTRVPEHITVARAAWGNAMPDWVLALAEECQKASQNKVAVRMGYSPATISLVLRAKYPGNLSAIEEVFKGVFQAAVVDCPALGTLPTHECKGWRDKASDFVSTNSLRVRMFRACNRCPVNGCGVEE